MYVCMYVYIYVYVRKCKHLSTLHCILCMHTCIHTLRLWYLCTNKKCYVYICMYVCICVHLLGGGGLLLQGRLECGVEEGQPVAGEQAHDGAGHRQRHCEPVEHPVGGRRCQLLHGG